jgi:hypothetical protein
MLTANSESRQTVSTPVIKRSFQKISSVRISTKQLVKGLEFETDLEDPILKTVFDPSGYFSKPLMKPEEY